MIELVIVSRLLEYPDAALWQHQQELFDALASSENLDKEDAQTLGVFLRDLTAQVAVCWWERSRAVWSPARATPTRRSTVV